MSYKIPREKMFEGILSSKEKALQFLQDAELLVQNESVVHSIIPVQYGIEEFGRASALKEKLDEGSMDEYSVEKRLFKDHTYKEEKAWSHLPSHLKTIYEGTFTPRVFDTRVFDTGETISSQTRIDATFIDWDDKRGEWKIGIRASGDRVLELIKGLRAEILKL